MPIARIGSCGSAGVNRDLSQHDLPIAAWTDARNVRFLNGSAWSFYGHSRIYGAAQVIPLHVMPMRVKDKRYWLYAGAQKIFAVGPGSGGAVHTNITPQSGGNDIVLQGKPNQWTSTLLGGIPVFNSGLDAPYYWNQELTNRMQRLVDWPNLTFCQALRSYKSFLVALNVTKSGEGEFPFMVKWSDAAEPGALPSWDIADPQKLAGEYNLAEGPDIIVDGMQLRDSFMIYKEQSVWRMDFVGGDGVMSFRKVLGTSGAMNKNCIAEVDGRHFVLTGSDVIVHDGEQAQSVLDRQSRRYLFQNIDVDGGAYCFVFKSPFTNEVFVCYPSVGSITGGVTSCDRALVWNYVDQTVSFKDIPNLNHAAFGQVPPGLNQSWDSDADPWDADLSSWAGPDFAPDSARVLMAPSQPALFMLDGAAAQDGEQIDFYLERRGLSLDAPEAMKLVTGIRPRVFGTKGGTILIRVGSQEDPWAEPAWCDPIPFVIGQDVTADCMVSGRYIALRFESGTAFQIRMDSYDITYEALGRW